MLLAELVICKGVVAFREKSSTSRSIDIKPTKMRNTLHVLKVFDICNNID